MVRTTLDGMAAGGMYDVLGGGFHRYSVDDAWLVPHFEKMLYDNALLAPTYLHAWLVTGEERYRQVAEETLDYMARDLRLPEGGFASAQDADTDGVEGLTYTWTAGEIEEVLGEPHPEWLQPFEHGRSVIRGDVPEEARRRLLEVRSQRPQPLPRRQGDHGLERHGPGRASRRPRTGSSGRTIWRSRSTSRAFLGETMSDGQGGLLRTYRDGVAKIDGYLEDYAHVANGYVELHWATGDPRWLEEAHRLARRAQVFADPERGGWFVGDHDLVARRKEFDDHPTPVRELDDGLRRSFASRESGATTSSSGPPSARSASPGRCSSAPQLRSGTCSARSTSTSPPRREVAVVGESEELRSAALAGLPAEHGLRVLHRSRPTRCRSSRGRASWTATRPPTSASASPARRP